MHFIFWMSVGFALATVYASFFEWVLHRYLMHRPVGKFTYAYRAHALVHHRIFKADHTYHLTDERDKATIPMAWWNGPVLVTLTQLPFAIVGALMGSYAIMYGSLLPCSAYYAAYEYMHWCMHLPKQRSIERSGIYFRLNGHHLLHHRYMNRNYNVVLPLADLCTGTLLLRSKVHFAQAQGPAVPNVQPKVKKSWMERQSVGTD
jgi:hypothetical protein